MARSHRRTTKPIRDLTDDEFEDAYGCDRVTAEIIRNAMVMASGT